jgi:hypothetical protein
MFDRSITRATITQLLTRPPATVHFPANPWLHYGSSSSDPGAASQACPNIEKACFSACFGKKVTLVGFFSQLGALHSESGVSP